MCDAMDIEDGECLPPTGPTYRIVSRFGLMYKETAKTAVTKALHEKIEYRELSKHGKYRVGECKVVMTDTAIILDDTIEETDAVPYLEDCQYSFTCVDVEEFQYEFSEVIRFLDDVQEYLQGKLSRENFEGVKLGWIVSVAAT